MVTESMICSKEEVMSRSAKSTHSITQRLVLSSAAISFIPRPLGQSSYFTDYLSINPVGRWDSRHRNQIQSMLAS